MFYKPFFASAVLCLSSVFAAAPDLTSSLEYVGNPANSRWSGSAQSRHVQDLHPYRGKIYTSGGEWGGNTGPCPCFAVDPYSGAYTNEFDAGTDAIYEFKEFSDGRLYTSAIDIHEGAANEGHTFRREKSGKWTNLRTCNVGSITNLNWQGYYIHNWDMAEYKKWVFVCGYGLSGSTNWCDKTMFNASPTLKDAYRIYRPGYTYTNNLGWIYYYTSRQTYRRFCAFLPFEDDCYAIPMQMTREANIQHWDFEEWRWDETANRFVCQTNTWNNLAPGVTKEMASFHFPSNSEYDVQIWHPTKFKNRVLYILGGHDYNITPWAAFSAVNENHHVKATRIDLGGADVKPFDIYATSNAVYLTAAQAGKTSSVVTNSVWKSTDGVNFTQLFTFTSTRQASALCYYDGNFYLGMGSNADTQKGWPKVTGKEVAGNIYRVSYPMEALSVVVETNLLQVVEGSRGSIRVRLASVPSADLVLSVRATGNASIQPSVTNVTFTPSDWNAWKEISFTVAQDSRVAEHPTGAIVCGTNDGSVASGVVRVKVADDDVAPTADQPVAENITDKSGDVAVVLKTFGTANGVASKSASVVFSLYSDSSYSKRVAVVTNAVTALGRTVASFTSLADMTRYYYKVAVVAPNGASVVQKGSFLTLEAYVPGGEDVPELRNYLVYEGFSTNDYATSTAEFGTVINGGPRSVKDSLGTAAADSKWLSSGSTQLLWYKPEDGLNLPLAMRLAGFKSRGTSVGANPANKSDAARSSYRALADGVLSPTNTATGKFCFRVLLNVDQMALEVAKKESWLITASNTTATSVNAYGAGFCRKPTANNYGAHLSEPSTIGFYIARNTNGVARAYMRTVSASGEIKSKVLGEAKAGSTYVFYAEAELKEGADIIRAGYQAVKDYSTEITWQGELTNDVFTASSYPTAMTFGGCYGTDGGYFRADEFAVGTRLEDVIATTASVFPGSDEPEEPAEDAGDVSDRDYPIDCAGKLEYVGNPNAKRWSNASDRGVTDLFFYAGKLFVSGGATEANSGPCPLQQIDPLTKAITVEKSAGTENISVFKSFSDGRLYVPSQDPRDWDSNYDDDGHVFVRDAVGNWQFYKNVPKGSAKDTDGSVTAAYVHNWDMEEYKGRTFVCGYGISFTTNGCASWKSATPHWTSSRMKFYYPTNVWDYSKKQWKVSGASAGTTYRREVQFMKFADRLLAIPYQYVTAGIPKQYYEPKIEVHRFNETTERFEEMTNVCSRVFPGLSTNDFKMGKLVNTYGIPYYTDDLKLWHTTPFSNRVFYVVSPYETYTNLWGSARKGYRETQYPYPMFACAADPTDDGLFTSTRLDFGGEEYPFDFLVKGPTLYALTAWYDKSDKQVRHTVWRSTDAKNFEKLLTFKHHQYLISMEYGYGYFYFGAGYKGASQVTYQLDSQADGAGNVYRLALPMEKNAVEVYTNQLSVTEGQSGVAKFRLAVKPALSVTLPIQITGGSNVTTSVKSLTFTPANWNIYQDVAFTVAQDLITAVPDVAVVCGYGVEEMASAAVIVKTENDDAAPTVATPKMTNLTYSGTEVSLTVSSLGTSNSVACASAKVSLGVYTDSAYANRAFLEERTVKSSGDVSFAVTNLTGGTKYYVRATVTSAIGISATATGSFSTKVYRETPPEGVTLVDLTKPTGNFSCSVTGSAAVMVKPFNDSSSYNDTNNRLCVSSKSFTIDYTFETNTVVNAYSIINFDTTSGRPPRAWSFSGSMTGTNEWVVLTTKSAQGDWTAKESRFFSFTNTVAYKSYRLSITENNGDTYTQFARLEYYCIPTATEQPEPGTDPDPGTDPAPGSDPKPETPATTVNYWIAAEGSDGLASTAANWSAGVPTAASDIVISPTNSSVTLIWDAAAPQTINSYRQYGLTNEVRTTFSTEFPVLTVTGDMIVEGGVLTHPRGAANVSANVSRLKLAVGGAFTLGTNATINLKGKGLAGGQKPTGSTAGSHAASCDGYAKVYGNVYRPEHPGSGSNGSNMWGGGALWLEVAGAATIDGTITVRPDEKDRINQPAAGSVYVKAASCSGTGYIYADYAATGYYEGGAGSGGRVAIELTEATTLGLAESHISVHGINAGGANGGGGTIFVKTADPTMPNGTLILDDTRTKSYGARWHKPTAVTAIPSGETWTFDAIKIKNYGVLAIPAGTKLVLPKGIASVTATSTRLGGLLYQGGEIDWGKGPYEFAQPWIFQANKPYTFNGNVTVKAGGALGCLQFMGSNDLSDFTKCDVVVNGDLTVEKGGYIWAESAGPDLNVDRTTSAYHGGQTGVLTYAAVYDSILDPSLPGWGMATGDRATSQPGGGVLKLTVNGALTVDGTITAYANKNGSNSEGAGGTINIRAKTLSGEGKITADCYKFTSQQYSGGGGGGRIAVRLTDQAVGTDGIFSRITAKGATVVASDGYKPAHSSSAGTVYLQGKDDAEGAGTIRVCNDGNAQSVDPYTPFPSKGNGAEAVDALKNASLFVGSCAKVKLFEAVEIQALAFDATGRLDLNGQTLTVASATVNGETLAAGTYRADTSRMWLVDSSTEAVGRLVVVGGTAPGLDPEADAPNVSGSSVGVVTSGGGAAGESVFSVSIGNVKAGLYYTTFVAEKLGDTFKASDGSVRATADGGLAFELPTGGKASLFVKVVVSSAPYSAGAELK